MMSSVIWSPLVYTNYTMLNMKVTRYPRTTTRNLQFDLSCMGIMSILGWGHAPPTGRQCNSKFIPVYSFWRISSLSITPSILILHLFVQEWVYVQVPLHKALVISVSSPSKTQSMTGGHDSGMAMTISKHLDSIHSHIKEKSALNACKTWYIIHWKELWLIRQKTCKIVKFQGEILQWLEVFPRFFSLPQNH